jgi:hypothetical protein
MNLWWSHLAFSEAEKQAWPFLRWCAFAAYQGKICCISGQDFSLHRSITGILFRNRSRL